MDTTVWHQSQSTLSSGWCRGDSYPPVLPNLRRLPAKGPIAEKPIGRQQNSRPAAVQREVEATLRIYPPPKCERRAGRRPLGPDQAGIGGVRNFETLDSPFLDAAFDDEAQLTQILAGSLDLESLCLADRLSLSCEFLASLGQLLPRSLRVLNLCGTRVIDVAIAGIVASCADLRSLDLSRCNLQDVSCVASLRDLQTLRMARSARAATPAFVGALRAAKKLQVLDLAFCVDVDDECLNQLSSGCHALRWLGLKSCPKVSDIGIIALATANPTIEHLCVALNPARITDAGMAQAVRCLKRVRCLDFAGCPQLQSKVSLTISRHCEFIEDLSFGAGRLTDEEVRPLLTKCLNLRRIDLTGCQAVTEDAIVEGLGALKGLQRVSLSLIPSITEQKITELRRLYPGCTFDWHAGKMMDPHDIVHVLGEPVAEKKEAAAKGNKAAAQGKGKGEEKAKKKGGRKKKK